MILCCHKVMTVPSLYGYAFMAFYSRVAGVVLAFLDDVYGSACQLLTMKTC